MNFNIQMSLVKFPDGLLELMADMTREVLRHQPENIFEFLADYLDALCVTRNKLQTNCLAI